MFSRGCSVDVPEYIVDGSVLPAGDIYTGCLCYAHSVVIDMH